MKKNAPKKRFGQNFLKDYAVLEGIVDAADVQEGDHILEIGPGQGALTRLMCQRGAYVYAVEIDKDLAHMLQRDFAVYERLTVIQGDILKQDLTKFSEQIGEPFKVVANLPYYITTPILMKLLELSLPITQITVMVQKEVAGRMVAAPGTKEYGALSVAVRYHTQSTVEMEVPPEAFYPRPKVKSCVVHMKVLKEPPVKVKDPAAMFLLVKAAFGQRRKTLVNAVSHGMGIDKEKIAMAAEELFGDPSIRGEKLSLEDFARLSDYIGKVSGKT